jgi:hypothetical protein
MEDMVSSPGHARRDIRRHLRTATVVLAVGAAGLAPIKAFAATSSTGTLSLSAGSLGISAMSSFTTTTTALTAGTLATPMNAATWSDTTGSGAGWNGTLAVQQFIDQGAWSQTSGTATALSSTASGAYTGTAGAGSIVVTVTQAADTGVAATLTISYKDIENGVTTNGTGTATKGTALVLMNGITITFASGTAYAQNLTYQSRFGILPTTALALNTAQASVTATGSTQAGSNLPTFVNNSTTVTAGGPSTYSVTPIKMVSAALLTGVGTFTVTGGATLTWDPNNVWQASYTANAQYNIVTGP